MKESERFINVLLLLLTPLWRGIAILYNPKFLWDDTGA